MNYTSSLSKKSTNFKQVSVLIILDHNFKILLLLFVSFLSEAFLKGKGGRLHKILFLVLFSKTVSERSLYNT